MKEEKGEKMHKLQLLLKNKKEINLHHHLQNRNLIKLRLLTNKMKLSLIKIKKKKMCCCLSSRI